MPKPDLLIQPYTDTGNAERLVLVFGKNIRYCPDLKTWLVWDGRRWCRDRDGELNRMVKRTARKFREQAGEIDNMDLREKADKWSRRSESATGIRNALECARIELGVCVSADQLDSNSWHFNCENGTVDLRTGILQPHGRVNMITKLAPVEYDPDAACPRWKRFLSEVFEPHPDLIPFIQRAVGYSLTGSTREECLFLLCGGGRNGKGTIIKTLQVMMGDYAGTADFSTFLKRRSDSGPRDDVANMRGLRMVAAQESSEGAALSESLIKWLTGGDRVRARLLYENSSEFDPTHKLWLATNHKPKITGTDNAIWSRLKVIPFDVSFEGREDRNLKPDLVGELPGILAWAVQGALDWHRHGLNNPRTVIEATGEYRKGQDRVRRFIAERCEVGEGREVGATSLYQRYRDWERETGVEAISQTAFGLRLGEQGISSKRSNKGMIYVGVGLASAGSGEKCRLV